MTEVTLSARTLAIAVNTLWHSASFCNWGGLYDKDARLEAAELLNDVLGDISINIHDGICIREGEGT